MKNKIKYGLLFLLKLIRLLSKFNKFRYIVFIHDAHKHGAQILGLNIVKEIEILHGQDSCLAILLNGGPMEKEFNKHNSIIVQPYIRRCSQLVSILINNECKLIYNSAVSHRVYEYFAKANRKTTSLVHELPSLISEYKLGPLFNNFKGDSIIFPSEYVKKRFITEVSSVINSKIFIKPQGSYLKENPNEESDLRQKHGIPKNAFIVYNMAYGDLRKGLDIFIKAANEYISTYGSDIYFIWFGNIELSLRVWMENDIQLLGLSKNIIIEGFQDKPSLAIKECNCFFLTSREDPYPSTVIDAVGMKINCVLFDDGNGYIGKVSRFLYFTPYLNTQKSIKRIFDLKNGIDLNPTDSKEDELVTSIKDYASFITGF